MRLKPQKRMGEPVIYRRNWKFCLIVKTQAHERMLLRYLRPSCASPFAYSDAETRGAPDCRSPCHEHYPERVRFQQELLQTIISVKTFPIVVSLVGIP